jgi:hypothetical protein
MKSFEDDMSGGIFLAQKDDKQEAREVRMMKKITITAW